MEKKKKDYVKISCHLRINGKFAKGFKLKYGRGKETFAGSLENFARIILTWDRIFDSGTTYADRVLKEAERLLPKKDGETAELMFEKYWINLKETMNKEFLEYNKEGGHPFFPAEGDYLKHCIMGMCESFDNAPLPVKHGFLYWLYKYAENGSIDELQADINATPEYIRQIVDKHIVEQPEY